MPVRVIFTYDEAARKWEAHAEGCTEALEARQAFAAVVITCQQSAYQLTQTIVKNRPGEQQAYNLEPVIALPPFTGR